MIKPVLDVSGLLRFQVLQALMVLIAKVDGRDDIVV